MKKIRIARFMWPNKNPAEYILSDQAGGGERVFQRSRLWFQIERLKIIRRNYPIDKDSPENIRSIKLCSEKASDEVLDSLYSGFSFTW